MLMTKILTKHFWQASDGADARFLRSPPARPRPHTSAHATGPRPTIAAAAKGRARSRRAIFDQHACIQGFVWSEAPVNGWRSPFPALRWPPRGITGLSLLTAAPAAPPAAALQHRNVRSGTARRERQRIRRKFKTLAGLTCCPFHAQQSLPSPKCSLETR
jgi:hypothetical protein